MKINHSYTLVLLFLFININAYAYEYPADMPPKEQIMFVKKMISINEPVYHYAKEKKDLEILRERVIAELLEPAINEDHIKNLMKTIREDGKWPDIDYEDVSRTGFEHSRHLSNMQELCRAYKKNKSPFFGNNELKDVIDAAFNLWLKHDFICDNWWWNQIGTPDRIVNILLIMDEELSEEQKEKAAPIAGRANLSAWGARPGGDLIKIAGILGKYALFTRDHDTLEKVVETMAKEIHFATDRGDSTDLRGLQQDMSFHHRDDRVTSILSYGLGYANAFADWAAKVAGTKYQFPQESIELLVDFYLDGICKAMAFGKYSDPGAKNRDNTRKGGLHAAGTELPEKLLQASNYRKDELEEIIKIRKGEKESELSFNKFFWHSEYLSHQRPKYFSSVRMFSTRNHSVEEPYNGEGLKNHHLADGSNFINRTGKEYMDIFPAWDWQKIPGTTVVQKPYLPAEDKIQQEGLTDFVGGVSDGVYGAAVFDFKSPLDSLRAKKSWFLFDKEIVCLGSGINSDAEFPVATTLNQCLMNKEVVVMQEDLTKTLNKGEHVLDEVNWVYHDGVTYLFPTAKEVHLKNQKEVGNWQSINQQSTYSSEEVSEEIFTLWLDHGVKPQESTYEYIILPGIEIAEIENYWKNPSIEILSNSPGIQAVHHSGLQISQIVFHEAGEIKLKENIHLIAENPGLIMIHLEGGKIKKLTVSDPSRNLKSFKLNVNSPVKSNDRHVKVVWNEIKGCSEILIKFPQNEYAGKSVVVEL
ncbi:polysaccharide lyase 8 family protein [soil metagenome]